MNDRTAKHVLAVAGGALGASLVTLALCLHFIGGRTVVVEKVVHVKEPAGTAARPGPSDKNLTALPLFKDTTADSPDPDLSGQPGRAGNPRAADGAANTAADGTSGAAAAETPARRTAAARPRTIADVMRKHGAGGRTAHSVPAAGNGPVNAGGGTDTDTTDTDTTDGRGMTGGGAGGGGFRPGGETAAVTVPADPSGGAGAPAEQPTDGQQTWDDISVVVADPVNPQTSFTPEEQAFASDTFKSLDVKTQREEIQHAFNLFEDEALAALEDVILDPETDLDVLDIAFNNLLNRPSPVKRKYLSAMADSPRHPYQKEAEEMLPYIE